MFFYVPATPEQLSYHGESMPHDQKSADFEAPLFEIEKDYHQAIRCRLTWLVGFARSMQ